MEMLAVIANTVVRRAVEILGPVVAGQLRDLILRKKDDPEDMLREAAKEGRDNLVGALIEAGADVNAQNTAFLHKGKSALIWAAEMGHANIVRQLLDGGANVTQRR